MYAETDRPDNPLTAAGTDGPLGELPAAEPQGDPLTDAELAERDRQLAAQADELVDPEPEQTRHAAMPADRVLRRIDRSVGAMGHDVEQLHGDVVRTQRAVQLLALSIAAVAALILVYALRAAKTQGTPPA